LARATFSTFTGFEPVAVVSESLPFAWTSVAPAAGTPRAFISTITALPSLVSLGKGQMLASSSRFLPVESVSSSSELVSSSKAMIPPAPLVCTARARPTPEDSLKAWASRPPSPKPMPTTRTPATETTGAVAGAALAGAALAGPALGGAPDATAARAANAASVNRERFIIVLLEGAARPCRGAAQSTGRPGSLPAPSGPGRGAGARA
jgi:hypothetical protein